MGRMGWWRGACVRRHISGALYDPARADWPGCAGRAGRAAGASSWSPRENGRAAARKCRGFPACRQRIFPASSTAAGTTVAYATVYAAYALYGFLPPPAAFILLGVVALLTLGAALLHGPALAGLGVVGGFWRRCWSRPPSPITGRCIFMLRLSPRPPSRWRASRLWPWLAVTAILLGALWTVPGADVFRVEAIGAHVFNVLAGFALAAVFLVCGLLYGPPAAPGRSRLALDARPIGLFAGRGAPRAG